MAQQIYPFTTAGNYTFDGNLIEVNGGVAELKIVPSAPSIENYNFDVPGDYTINSPTLSEISGGAFKLSTQPSGFSGLQWIPYNDQSGFDAQEGGAVGSVTGLPTVSGGNLVLTPQANNRFVDYGIGHSGGGFNPVQFYVRFRFTPNFNGQPTVNQHLFSWVTGGQQYGDLIWKGPNPQGGRFFVQFVANNNVFEGPLYVSPSAFSGTAGVYTEIQLLVNYQAFSPPQFAFWINGTYQGNFSTGGQSGGTVGYNLRVGASNGQLGCNVLVDDVQVYNGLTALGNYTSPVVFNELPYTSTPVYADANLNLIDETLSNGLNNILTFVEASTTPANTEIKYNVSNDDGSTWYYWDGANIVLSNGTFAQANDATTWASQLNALETFVQGTEKLRLRFWLSSTDGLSTPELDNIQASHDTIGYDVTNPDILTNISFNASTLTSFIDAVTNGGGDTVKYQLVLDGINKYWNGSAWVNGAGYAQTNTASEVNTNIGAFLNLTNGALPVQVRAFLHSDTGASTPTLDSITVDFTLETTSPVVTQFDPSNGSVSVPVAQNIVVTFNEALDPATVTGANIFITDEGNGSIPVPLNGAPVLSAGDTVVTLDPLTDLNPNDTYKVHVTTNVTDVAGNPAVADFAEFFTEVGQPPFEAICFVYSTIRDANANPVEGAKIIAVPLDFDESASNNVVFLPVRVTATTNSAGAFQLPLVQSGQYQASQQYSITIKYRDIEENYTVTIPAQATAELKDLI